VMMNMFGQTRVSSILRVDAMLSVSILAEKKNLKFMMPSSSDQSLKMSSTLEEKDQELSTLMISQSLRTQE